MARNLDDTGKHLIAIIRQGGQAAKLVRDALLDGRDDILKKILTAIRSGATQAQITVMIHREVAALGKTMNGILIEQGELAGAYQAGSSSRYLAVLGVSDPKTYNVTETFVRRSFNTVFPEQNISVNDMLKGTLAKLDQDLVNITRRARTQGETIRTTRQAIEAASGSLDDPNLRRKADALARTAVTQVANDVRYRSFDQEPEVEGVLYVATLDHRTSNICKSLDGTFYRDKSKARIPPLHVNCRSTVVPVLEGEKLSEVTDQLRRPAVEPKSTEALKDKGLRTSGGKVRKPSRSDRSPLKGVQKREYMTYEQWLKTQSVTYQKAILGNRAYGVFKSTGDLKRALGFAE